MAEQNSFRLLRNRVARAETGDSHTGFYRKIKAGLMTPAVRISEASSAWPEHEIAAINRARIAGKTDDEIRALVRDLVAARKSAAA